MDNYTAQQNASSVEDAQLQNAPAPTYTEEGRRQRTSIFQSDIPNGGKIHVRMVLPHPKFPLAKTGRSFLKVIRFKLGRHNYYSNKGLLFPDGTEAQQCNIRSLMDRLKAENPSLATLAKRNEKNFNYFSQKIQCMYPVFVYSRDENGSFVPVTNDEGKIEQKILCISAKGLNESIYGIISSHQEATHNEVLSSTRGALISISKSGEGLTTTYQANLQMGSRPLTQEMLDARFCILTRTLMYLQNEECLEKALRYALSGGEGFEDITEEQRSKGRIFPEMGDIYARNFNSSNGTQEGQQSQSSSSSGSTPF